MSLRSESKASSPSRGCWRGRSPRPPRTSPPASPGATSVGSPMAAPVSWLLVASLASRAALSSSRCTSLTRFRSSPSSRGAVGVHLLGGHLVLGECARLVRADDGHRAQALHRLQVLDDGVLPAIFWVPMASTMVTMEERASGMAATARATANMRESSTPPCPVRKMDRGEHRRGDDMMTTASLAEKLSRLSCRGGLALLGLVHESGDLAQFGVHARAGDQHGGPAVGHQGAGEHHVLLVPPGPPGRR